MIIDIWNTILQKLDVESALILMEYNDKLITDINILDIKNRFFQRDVSKFEKFLFENDDFKIDTSQNNETIIASNYHKNIIKNNFKYSPNLYIDEKIIRNLKKNNSKFYTLSKGIQIMIKINKNLCEHVKEIHDFYLNPSKLTLPIRNSFHFGTKMESYKNEIFDNLHYIYDNDVLDKLKNLINNNSFYTNLINIEYINKNNFYKCNLTKFYNIHKYSKDIKSHDFNLLNMNLSNINSYDFI
jgi:hypothetical protein